MPKNALTRRGLFQAAAWVGGAALLPICYYTIPKFTMLEPTRLSYGSDKHQFGELRVPFGAGPHPVVMVIHGGFWRDRYDLRHIVPVCEALTSAGWATWSIEYRRIGNPGGGFPGTFEDVGRAADHLRELAGTYPLALDRAVVLGHSAGGHLALWVGGRHRLPQSGPLARPADPFRFRGIVALAAVTDLHLAHERKLGIGVVPYLMGGTPGQFPQRYAAGSPAALLPLGVPQVLVHGTDDTSVPLEFSQTYQATAQAKGDRATLIELPGTDHFALIQPDSKAWPKIQQAVAGLSANHPGPEHSA